MAYLLPDWLRGYRLSWLKNDMAAGAATWAVLVPLSLSIAAIAGVEPVIGLIALPAALIAYALFGGQRVLVMGPDTAVAILSGGIIATIAVDDESFLALTVLMSLCVGAIYVVFGALRMGWTADLVPDPVLKGFTEGIIWLTLIKQSVMLLGLEPEETPSGALGYIVYLSEALFDVHGPSLMIGAASIACLLLRALLPRWPSALIVLVAAIAISSGLDLSSKGVAVLGTIEGGLPGFSLPPGLTFDQVTTLLSGALAIVVLGYTKALAPLRRASEHSGEAIAANRELVALGATNIGAGIAGGHAVSASLTATSVGIGAGAKSQIANLVAAALCVLTLLFLLPHLYALPLARLAAIIMVALGGASNLSYFRKIGTASREELLGAVAALLGVLAFGVLPGVLIGVLLALFQLAHAIHDPVTTAVGRTPSGGFVDLDEHPDAQHIPGMLILHQYGPLVFLNARILADALRKAATENEEIRVVVLDATSASGVDTTAVEKLAPVRDEFLQRGIEIWIVNPRHEGWLKVAAFLSAKHMAIPPVYDTLQDAIDAFESGRVAPSGPTAAEAAKPV